MASASLGMLVVALLFRKHGTEFTFNQEIPRNSIAGLTSVTQIGFPVTL